MTKRIRPFPISDAPQVAVSLIQAVTGKRPRFAAVVKPDPACGNCQHFQDEASDGMGWCAVLNERTECGCDGCQAWEARQDAP